MATLTGATLTGATQERTWRTIQEVADATGLSTHTLRYYEKAGLLAPIERSEGGIRRYSERNVDSLLFVTRLRSTGMPIHKIREYVSLIPQGAESISERKRMLERHRADVLDQIAHLQQCLTAVDYKIGLYEQGWVPLEGNDPCLAQLRTLCAPIS